MAVSATGASLFGADAVLIQVEVDLLRRLPRITFVGLAAHAVQEAAERVRSAILAAGFEFPRARVVINLAPADVRKDGTALDLPVALAILAADGVIPLPALQTILSAGELGLDGSLRPVRGAVAIARLARERHLAVVLPESSASEAALVPGVRVFGATQLLEVIQFLRGERPLPPAVACKNDIREVSLDLSDVRGQALARRALEISAAGGHHLAMIGPPGCGKSMLARRLPGILPELTPEEALDVARIRGAAGLSTFGLPTQRPFRAPHHTVTTAGLVGDRRLRPGEITLAHHGVLFLDEAPELSRPALEVLRTPLEDGVIRIVRAEGPMTWPAAFTLILAANPCPCGRRGSGACRCTDHEISRYRRKLSGPLLDRIDLHLDLEPVSPDDLLDGPSSEPTHAVRHRVMMGREVQYQRGQSRPNAWLEPRDLDHVWSVTSDTASFLSHAARQLGLSGRGIGRVRRVSRTIADLAGSPMILEDHIAEALSFRPQD